MLKEAFFAVAAGRELKMDRVRPAMLIAALVVDVARRKPRRCGSAVPQGTLLLESYRGFTHPPFIERLHERMGQIFRHLLF
eukprot:COSAG05_NODE_33_length_28089_cov_31.909289_32_plen_81_part_00